MRTRHSVLPLLTAVALALNACGTDGPHYGGEPTDPVATFGQCALCHEAIATRMTETGGHHDLDIKCQFCHAEELLEPPGPGHRSVPVCAECHSEQQTHNDPEAGMPGECLQCHNAHGSFNLLLVNEGILTPSNGLQPVEFDNRDGRADGSYASVSQPGTGVCEICHSTTKFYRNDGSGAEHFTTTCVECHAHEAGFAVSVPLDQCELCHGGIVARTEETGGHGALDGDCQACHQELLPGEVGPGHRSRPACANCHTEQQTHHDPAADTAGECLQCHNPHGSFNLLLVNEGILTPTNGLQPVEFDNREGRADGSFASASQPGTGVCEICHSTTKYYRNDGSGAAHFTTTCVECHAHEAGFAVSVPVDQCELCHGGIVTRMEETGGHGALDSVCEACHQNLLPGEVGEGHRSRPACADCHSEPQTHHDPEADTARECLQCHNPHGSFNLLLVNEGIPTPSNGLQPVEFDNRDGRADGSYASASQPGTGVCEICHSTTKFYRNDGSGAPHFTTTCVQCHGHEKGFGLVSTTDCSLCHGPIVSQMDETGGHGAVGSLCEACHQNLLPGEVGEGHRSVPRCKDCHRNLETHMDPAAGAADECTQCHTPHGSLNLLLVKQSIRTLTGTVRAVTFTNREGRADGSFASASSPGTGVCEICHRFTEFYRSNGSGEEHLTTTCTDCHLHTAGFEPPDDD